MTGPPDPIAGAWPRRTDRCLLRPVRASDLEAMLAYRGDPHVTEHLGHAPLSREEVRDRIDARPAGRDPGSGRVVRGVAIVVDGRCVGDAMLRLQPAPGEGGWQLWIGYALRPEMWGRGLATEVATELVGIAQDCGLPVWAETFAENLASQRVLEKAGLELVDEVLAEGRHCRIFAAGHPGSPVPAPPVPSR
ncbi:GNAT family N-acetyltransferase [Kocuria sp. CNJ-770]|uniref:GNAT family N-acetyltransferase n=1 Tax=Kocuria sp. CNJ-770 TaxID=1904964 RepID=UPI00096AA4F1|nr:GNAT family N-acetyltransferase [Kocuria sp. CNJ-770]